MDNNEVKTDRHQSRGAGWLGLMAFAVLMTGAGADSLRADAPAKVPAAVTVVSSSAERSDSKLILNGVLDVRGLAKMRSDRELWLTPVLRSASGPDSLVLDSVCVAGHNRYYLLLRHGYGPDMARRASRTEQISLHSVVDYCPWMEHSTLYVRLLETGCCDEPLTYKEIRVVEPDFRVREFEAEWVYVTPPGGPKRSTASGSAYIDFPVNRTELYPDYRRNPEELASIRATIDRIRTDEDITIDSVRITGYASPEGPYANNERLAQGRTATLADYVRDLYSFPADVVTRSWVAEDWAGLESRLLLTDIINRDAILAIVRDRSLGDDARDAKIRKDFPIQYKWMLANIYPALRHSDYSVHYTVADYTDIDKIAEVMRSSPQKLSLSEMFSLAETLSPDSDDYREVFEVAVRMYPDSEVANLNAANTALRHKDFSAAGRYLAKSGNSATAQYARGLYHALSGDYAAAVPFFEEAADAGIVQAADAITQLKSKELIK